MAVGYASLQLVADSTLEAAQERIMDAVTACMDRQGLVPCDKASAERTVAFARTEKGWAVFDDCADRLDMVALDHLGRGLTEGLLTRAVGVMCSGESVMMRLYANGRLQDIYMSPPAAFGKKSGSWLRCRGHALRWRAQLPEGGSIKELAALFTRGERESNGIFSALCTQLDLDATAGYGFASIEEAGLQGVITLYFRPSNVVKQRLRDKPAQLIRRMGWAVSTLIRKPAAIRKKF